MSIQESLGWQSFGDLTDDATTEGKAGVPRYNVEPAKLQEYIFRVRLRQAREKGMSEEEVKKKGPLALRLIDGLRGPALHVIRALPIDQLRPTSFSRVFSLPASNSTRSPRGVPPWSSDWRSPVSTDR